MRRSRLLKLLATILLVAGFLIPSTTTALSSTTIKLWIGNASMSVNGVQQPIDAQGTKPVIVAGRTLVPIRAVIEAFGGSVAWEASTRKATVTLGKDSLDLWIGKSQASLNGIALAIDSANSAVVPVITGGRTMLPLRFVAESLGIDVQYDATTKMITLTYTVGTTPPALLAPLLLGPAPNAVLSVLTPTLSWTAVPGATKYEVRIWVGSATLPPRILPGFTSSPYVINTVLATTSYAVPLGTLSYGVRYGWTVAAGNSVGWSANATIPGSTYAPAFMVQVTVLAAPHLVSPATEVILSTLTPTLSWTAVPGATKYGVHIWVASATPPPYVVDEVLATTSYTIPSGVLTAGVQYAWTVYAGNSLGWSASLTAPGSTYVPVFMVQAAFQAPSPGVIETQINGEFTGWDGDTIFELTNGQIWQQDSYAYTYHYAYRPKVLIYYVGGRYKMTVEGVDGFIYVTRLK